MSLSTVDFSRLTIAPGDRVLDVGCGEGRHTLSAWLELPVHAVGLDLSHHDLSTAAERRDAFAEAAGADAGSPDAASADAASADAASADPRLSLVQGSALDLPFPDESFDVVICSEVLEHIHDYRGVLAEITRVLRSGGQFVVSVPRAWPERLCWLLSAPYHEAPGGHIRIFAARELRSAVQHQGFRRTAHHWAHALHVPYWWLRCATDPDQPEASRLVRLWHRLLVWDLMSAPRITRAIERMLDPLLGKSVVMYFVKEIS